MPDAVLLPGSYDPVTLGHLNIIERAALLFDHVHVVIFINPDKQYTFTVEERLQLLTAAISTLPPSLQKKICLATDDGMVIDYSRRHGISLIVKGVRNQQDFVYEQKMAAYNLENGGVETVFMQASPNLKEISSTSLRKALAQGRALEEFSSPPVIALLHQFYEKKD